MFNEIQEWFLWDQIGPAVDREENLTKYKLSEHNISYGDACFFAPVMKGCEAMLTCLLCVNIWLTSAVKQQPISENILFFS